jgi:aspartyl-tRNA(Asn)/glutamyl-tRNA(Gln) amidotransferase subunit A
MYDNYLILRKDLEQRKISCKDIVKHYLTNIKSKRHLNIFLSVYEDDALLKAEEIDLKINTGNAGKLAGLIVGVKDVLSVEGKPMTCASKILENFIPLYTATSVNRLIEQDAIIIGKTNCDEFAMGSSNENSAFGNVLNPINEKLVPGGSSGGSAAAVAADMCMVSLGTDTGGSIRQPAAFCGVFGLKPTYGRVSRYGLTAFASSFDTVGPFAKNPLDIALVLNSIAGYDSKDSTSVKTEIDDYLKEINNIDLNNLKVGILSDINIKSIQSEIKESINNAIEFLKSKGAKLINIGLPYLKYSIQTYYILTTAEASSNLARYDGARYGKRTKYAENLEDMYINSRTEGFGQEVKRRIMLGTYVLSHGYYDAYYKKAQKVRRLIKQDFKEAFKKVDYILMPTTPSTAFKIGEKISDPLEMYLNDIFTTSSNLAGNPSINIPIGKDKNNLPIGLQIIGDDFNEKGLLQISNYIFKEYNQA